ncbi:hypothetical protein BJY04DRAFT_208317 [Aspergillus karnatakaensis]|uniref:uncharacterized protein n=1 Tax=Aspergillus karnatakaensis TaxID=1810916 RepID=UPI003CCE0E23
MSHTREGSRDRELVLSRHHQTVPISDPERAPPPLPLNPGSTSPITKANVSPNIQAVAANFTEKLRDNSPSPYTTNPMTPKSPEKSLIKGQFHKRMQSLQNTDTRSEFLNYLESRSPERPLRASFSEHGPRSPEKAAPMPESPSDQQVSDQETPNLLISNRYLSRPLFGESTPTSATMLALQTMQLPPEHEPEPRIKEPDFPETKHSQPSSLEFLSTQILSLTDIASNLQREMTQLSRRSKDNATDLISLKAATNARDEDIRKSLRDLSSNLASKFLDADGATRWDISALLGSESGINQSELDSSPNSKKSYSVPRMQSPSPFMAAMEREFCASPGPISDGSASIALLEKVLREMATKEGQEKLLELVNELKARPASDDSSKTGDNAVTKMLEEILNIVKQDSGTKALVRSQAAGANKDLDVTDLDEAYASVADVTHPNHTAMNDTRLTEEMMDILKRVRSSVIEGGGMTNEVKALVRELRGEVLGMGRNLARKLEDVEHTRAIEDTPKGPGSAEIAEIVDSSLQELRTQMTSIMNDNKRQSSALTEFRAAMDSAELYSIVKKALDHFGSSQLRNEPDGARMQKEDILEAVREAWETYKPEIELQNFGLERDEILDCLSEGLKAYQPQHEQAVTYDQVLAAVQAGIQQFEQTPTITKDDIVQTIQECLETPQPPRSFDDGQLAAIRDEVLHAVTESMTSQSALTRDSFDSGLGRDEILSAVSDGIEAHMVAAKELEHKPITKEDVASIISDAFSAQQSALTTNGEPPISREEIISAITEGLESQSSIPREIELNKDDLMDAITAGLNEVTANANQGLGDQILERLNAQFESVKDEVKQRPSETGEATEHLVNLIKDSIAIVRQDVEGYVATASEAAGKYEVMDTVKEGFRLLQADLEKTITETSLAHPPGGNPDTPELLDAMEKEFEHLRQTIIDDKAKDVDSKDEIMAALRDFVENHKPDNSEHISTLLQQEFERLRESLMLTIVPAEQKSDKEEIIAAVQATLEAFHEVEGQPKDGVDKDAIMTALREFSESHNPDSAEKISTLFQQEFERLRDSLATSLVPTATTDKDEIIAAVQATLEAFHEVNSQTKDGTERDEIVKSISNLIQEILIQEKLDISENQKPNSNEDITSLIQQEFERLRDSLTMSIVPAESKDDKDDIVTSVHAALATYYEEKDKAKEGTEAAFPTTELTDAFHDGVGVIREDLAKLLERPVEFDASELLDTLKDGLSSLKAEVESIRQSQVASEEATSSSSRELMLANESSMTNDIEGIKNLISQLQAKVDAIEAAPRAPDIPEDLMRKEHMDEVLLGLHELQTAVTVIAARDFPAEVTLAKKEDTDAIETLLRSTKTQLDEMVFPAPDEIARAEQLGSLEDIVKETKDVVTELYGRLDAECPTKADIGTLETLMKEMWIALDESKTKEGEKEGEVEGETETEKLVKADLQTVEAMIFEVKSQVEELKLPDVETLPTKTEIQDLANLMNEFKEKVEADQELTGQGFEARKIEHAGLAEKIDEARAVVEGLGEELKSKLDGSHDGLSELKQLLEGLAASAESFTTVANVNELTELINREFERARGEQDATKLEKEERDASVLVKHDETKAAIIVELSAKIDERFGEVIAKYDEAQSSTDSKFAEAAERDNQNLEAVANTRALAEDIKLVIGSMGDSVNEACERMSADTKTLLEKVDVSYSKMEEQQQQARSDVERAAAATERVETTMHEFHPKVLESIQEILSIVGQHYNHSQQAAQDLKMDLSILPTTIPQMLPALPAPEPEKYDDSELHTKLNNLLEHSKGTQVQDALNVLIERVTSNQVHEKLDQLLGQTTSTNGQVYDKLSELLDQATASKGPIHEKLDTLIDHATNTTQSVNQMMKLDEMHKDIMETSRKMNEMLASQSALVAEDTERRRREAEEAAVALERRTAQREQIEAEILNLQDEKESMLAMIHRLKAEKDELTAQNAKLNKDVSALETALELRHEEMQVMEERADSLEKRILEGVLDHARTVLLSRPKSVQGLSMKKVRARNMSASSTASTAKDSRSILGSSIGLALKKRAPLASQASSVTTPATPKERRILSLSNVTGNRGLADRQSGTSGGLANLKRSQSVKSNFSYRKSSWGGRSSVANKENEVFPEEDENLSGDESDTGTERRTSYTGTYAGSMTYGPGSVISERHVSNTHDDTSTIARSIDGDENEEDDTIEEKDEDAGSDVEAEVEVEAEAEAEAQAAKDEEPKDLVQQLKEQLDEKSSKMVLYAPPSDSGLGSEITSAAG